MKQKRTYYLLMPLKASALCVWGILFLQGIQALIPSAFAVLTASIVNHTGDIMRLGSIEVILPQLYVLFLLILFQFNGNTLQSLLYTQLRTRIRECFEQEILKKISMLPYSAMEDSGTYELINRIAKTYDVRITDGFRTYLRAGGNALQLLSVLWLILAAGAWRSAVVLLLFSIPLAAVSIRGGKRNYDASVQAAAGEQRAAYLNEVLLGGEAVLERGFFGFSGWMQEKWSILYNGAQQLRYHARARAIIRMKLSSIFTVFASMIVCGMLVSPLLRGQMSLGTFFGLTTAIFHFVTLVSWEIADTFDQLAQGRAYCTDLAGFFALEETDTGSGEPWRLPGIREIVFENVSFRYPGCENYVLRNVNMTLQHDKHYAIVGINGAGKSTLMKLMCGLYTDYEGTIRINGNDIRTIPYNELRRYFSIAWQNFARYQIPLNEYLKLSGETEENAFWELLRLFEMDGTVASWQNGLQTPLGKLKENGQEVSQGQWQRLMLVKTLLQKGAVKVFDEPTSAIDPVGESRLYDRIAGWTKGKLTLFITHRLGAARMADEILVLDQGTVAEKGSHQELIRLQGLYAEMYNTQREWYVNGK